MEAKVLNLSAVSEKFADIQSDSKQRFVNLKAMLDELLKHTEYEDIASLTQSLNGSPYTGATEIGRMFKAAYDTLCEIHQPVDGVIKASRFKDKKSYTLAMGIVDDIIVCYDTSTFKKSSK